MIKALDHSYTHPHVPTGDCYFGNETLSWLPFHRTMRCLSCLIVTLKRHKHGHVKRHGHADMEILKNVGNETHKNAVLFIYYSLHMAYTRVSYNCLMRVNISSKDILTKTSGTLIAKA